MKKYTLDRIEDGQYVFLDFTNEEEQLILPILEIHADLTEGDVVNIHDAESTYEVEVLKDETDEMRSKVSSLLEKLKNKNK